MNDDDGIICVLCDGTGKRCPPDSKSVAMRETWDCHVKRYPELAQYEPPDPTDCARCQGTGRVPDAETYREVYDDMVARYPALARLCFLDGGNVGQE